MYKSPIIQWHLTEDERSRIASGENIYLFYFPEDERYSLEIGPEDAIANKHTISLLVDEPAPQGIYFRDRTKD